MEVTERVEAEQVAVIGKVRLLGVKQEKDGVKHEDISMYKGWI